jgi:hypothetical protein
MNTSGTAELPRIGDHVVLRGTRIVGDVARVERHAGVSRVTVKVTAVLGKKQQSKTSRAWHGAWVTCPPAQVLPVVPSPN